MRPITAARRVTNQIPRAPHVPLLRLPLPDRHPERVAAAEHRVGEVHVARRVDPPEQLLVPAVERARVARECRRLVPEADEAERRGRRHDEPGFGQHPGAETFRQRDVVPQHRPETLDAVASDHEPELEGAELPAELDAPVAVVDDVGIMSGLQIGGRLANVRSSAGTSRTKYAEQGKLVSSHCAG